MDANVQLFAGLNYDVSYICAVQSQVISERYSPQNGALLSSIATDAI